MPYIITINTPVRELIDGRMCETTCGKTTRRAVATLEEANEVVYAEGTRQMGAQFFYRLGGLRPEGGTVGPLPDGTMIEVRPTTYLELDGAEGIGETEPREHATHRAILDAYNARVTA